MHLPVPTHLPTLLLSLLYAAALVVAATAPGHALAGCVVLAGLVTRTVVRRRRSTTAVDRSAAVVDVVLPGEVPAPAT